MIPALVYDTRYYPITFDSCNFFAIASGICHKLELPSIHLIVLGPTKRDMPIERDYSWDFLYKKFLDTIISLAAVCPMVTGVSIFQSAADIPPGIFKMVVKGYLPGDPPPRLYDFKDISRFVPDTNLVTLKTLFVAPPTLDDLGRQYTGKIVFFPRRSVSNPARNTPIGLFEDAAAILVSQGHDAIIIHDSDGGVGLGNGGTIASRLTIAKFASLSITWGGGISAPLWFSAGRVIITGLVNESIPVDSAEMAARKGPFRYSQPEWFGNEKIFDWTDNTLVTPEHLAVLAVARLAV